jgi:phosphoglucosamine mutase
VPQIRAQVGDRHVMQQLKAHGGVLGGETSGHILCLDRTTTGDGIISSLAVLEALVNQDEDLASAREGLHKLPQSTRNVRATGGRALVASAPVQAALQAVKDKLDGHGRVVLRPSGTEPVIRVTIETADAKEVETLVDFLAEAVKSADAAA